MASCFRIVIFATEVKAFADSCKAMTQHLKDNADPAQLAQDKERFIKGYDNLLRVSEQYTDKPTVQAFCASVCEKGVVAEYMAAYTAYVQKTMGKADPSPIKNLGLGEEDIQRQKNLSNRAKTAPPKPEAAPVKRTSPAKALQLDLGPKK